MNRFLRSALFPLVAIVIVVFAVSLFVGGCADSGSQSDPDRSGVGSYKAIVIQYGGRPLHCVEREGFTGIDTTSGAYSGLTCDFVAYHQEGGG